jgi:hypothetical protein
MMAKRKRPGIQGIGDVSGLTARVQPNLAEVAPQARFEEIPGGVIEGLPAGFQAADSGFKVGTDRRRSIRIPWILAFRTVFRRHLPIHPFFLTIGTRRRQDPAVDRLAPHLIVFILDLPAQIGWGRFPVDGLGLQKFLFLLLRLALNQAFHFVPARGTLRRSAGGPLDFGLRHAHDRIGHPVGLPLAW